MQLNIDYEDVLKQQSEGYQRCQRLRRNVINAVPHICIERARYLTESFKETEGEARVIRLAKGFANVLGKMKLLILDGEMILGHQASMHRSAPLYPEFAVDWIKEEIDTFPTRPQDKFAISSEVKREFLKDIYPYWEGKTLKDRLLSYLTEDIKLQRFDTGVFSLGIHEEGGLGHVYLNYEKVLSRGLEDIKAEIQAKLDAEEKWTYEYLDKMDFYKACIIICDALITFANRYSKYALELSEKEKDPKRKSELENISRICVRVPEKPARSFYEALQSFWFIQVAVQIYDNGVSISPGRFDQYMYPYYSNDIINDVLSKEEAQELLECFWVKFTEPIKLYKKQDAAYFAGYPMGQNLCVGGVDRSGLDSTNDLSLRCLEAHCHHLLMQPNFTVRMHKLTPFELQKKAVEAIGFGNGMPQIVNDDVFIPGLAALGVNLQDARDYGIVGCVEGSPLNTWGRVNGGYINLLKLFELATNNGKCRITGLQAGPETGDPESFSSFEELFGAYEAQMKYSVKLLVSLNNIVDKVHAELMPTPLTSMLVDDCIEKGLDVTAGGAHYNWTGPSGIGIANTADSLYAVKKTVFEDAVFSMKEIKELMDCNYQGMEDKRQYLINKVDKYGNDYPEVDLIAKRSTDVFINELESYTTYRGGKFITSLLPVSSYVAFGMNTGATSDGRYAKDPLADGISPSNGMDRNGPTSAMKSVCTIDHLRCPNGIIFNQKFSPSTLETDALKSKFINLVRTYLRLGGQHIQFNVISAETLKDAKLHPEKHSGLVVRVAGYSAFFNELAPEIQDSIIARTEHELGV